MVIDYAGAVKTSISVGVLLGLVVGVRYIVRIERHQRKLLEKIEDIQKSISTTEKKILEMLSKNRKE